MAASLMAFRSLFQAALQPTKRDRRCGRPAQGRSMSKYSWQTFGPIVELHNVEHGLDSQKKTEGGKAEEEEEGGMRMWGGLLARA